MNSFLMFIFDSVMTFFKVIIGFFTIFSLAKFGEYIIKKARRY